MAASELIPYSRLDGEQRALVGSEDWIVRQKAAQQGYGLDRLVLDRNEHVRFAVAAQGYGLDALALDPSPHVRNRASGYLIARYGNAFELDRWREKEPDKVFEDMAVAGFLAGFPHPWTPRLMGLSYIRVLVPDSSEYYRLGHGESCWVLADEHAHEAYVNNAEAEEGLHFGVLAEDCPVYADLSRGRIIPFEMRGRKRPMCPIDWLRRHFTLSEDHLLPAALLATPMGREQAVEGLVGAYDDRMLDERAFAALRDKVYAAGPVAGFPLGQTVQPLGFACTDYACELEEHEQVALRAAIGEVLAEQHPGEDVGPLVDAAMDGRICDIGCMDAAGYVNAMRIAEGRTRNEPPGLPSLLLRFSRAAEDSPAPRRSPGPSDDPTPHI